MVKRKKTKKGEEKMPTDILELTSEQKQLVATEVTPIVEKANALIVRTSEDSFNAQTLVKELKRRRAMIYEKFDPPVRAAHAAWKASKDLFNYFIDPFDSAETIIKRKIVTYEDDAKRKREEEQRKAEAESRRIEAEKQAKIQAKIDEENRKIREAQAEEARKQREKDAELAKIKNKERQEQLRREEEERRIKQAQIDEENRKKAEAKKLELEERKENVAAPLVFSPPEPPKAEGTGFKKVWEGECYNIMELLSAIVQGKAPVTLIEINQSALNAAAKTYKNTHTIPGLHFFEKSIMSSRIR